jgi:hypothetical protein
MPFTKLAFKPGINKEGTNYSNEGGYYNCDKIRFRSGYPEKLGGWQNQSYIYTYNGVARSMMNWVSYDSYNLLGFGTNQKYYIQQGNVYNDVTPLAVQPSTAPTSIVTTLNSKVVTVNAVGHGASPGTFVTLTTTASVGGLTISGEYEIVTTPDGNSYTIASTTAASSAATGGGTITASYSLTAGNSVATNGVGWGNGPWGGTAAAKLTGYISAGSGSAVVGNTLTVVSLTSGTIATGQTVSSAVTPTIPSNTAITAGAALSWTVNGSAISVGATAGIVMTTNAGQGGWGQAGGTAGVTLPLRLWSQDTYGQDLLMAPVGGDIYYWTKDVASYARAVTLETKANATSTGIITTTSTYSNPGDTSITVNSTDGINTGSVINGFDITSGTYVTTAWTFSTTLTLSAALTNIAANATITGTTTLTINSGGVGMVAGMIVTGTGIPAGTSITGTFPTFTLSAASANATITIAAGGIKSGEGITVYYAGRHVPNSTNYIIASDTSHFTIALGANPYNPSSFSDAFDPMLVRWSDQDNPYEWVPSATNQSGEQHLSNGSFLVCAQNTRQEILVWSNSALFSMQYVGPPYVWNFTLIGDNTSIASPNAAIAVNTVTYWMGVDKFYQYNGRLETLNCTIWKYVYDNLNRAQTAQIICGTNEGYSEIWWYYPSVGSDVNDSYVIYNYLDQTWYYGSLNRTAWLDSPLRQYPQAAFSLQSSYLATDITSTATSIPLVDSTSYPASGTVTIGTETITYTGNSSNTLTGCTRGASNTTAATAEAYTSVTYSVPNQMMFHENGCDDKSTTVTQAIAAYVESSDFDIGDGNNFGFITRVIPDLTFRNSTAANPSVMMTFKARTNTTTSAVQTGGPGSAYQTLSTTPSSVTRTSSASVEQFTSQVFVRVRGRQAGFRVDSSDLGVAWQLGSVRIDVRQDGRR